jgi:hypothetical protein
MIQLSLDAGPVVPLFDYKPIVLEHNNLYSSTTVSTVHSSISRSAVVLEYSTPVRRNFFPEVHNLFLQTYSE